MLRTAVAFAFIGLSSLAREPGCGGADSPSSGVNAPCTRTKDCSGDLECTEGVCSAPDAGAHDAASSRGPANDGG